MPWKMTLEPSLSLNRHLQRRDTTIINGKGSDFGSMTLDGIGQPKVANDFSGKQWPKDFT